MDIPSHYNKHCIGTSPHSISRPQSMRCVATAARQQREDARVRAASAEGEARALRGALAEARRPTWRRWLDLP